MAGQALSTIGFALILTTLSTGLRSEDGQYRSKVLIDPSGALEKGTAQSVEQLEQQLDSLSDPYAKAAASRHIARVHVERKQYDKAIRYYETALAADGLSAVADRELLRELARVYLLQEDYTAAVRALERALQYDLVQEPVDYLLLAQAWFQLGDYVKLVKTLDQLQSNSLPLDLVQQRQALALYYKAGAYSQCADLLHSMLEYEPDNAQYWHQLAAIYLLQNKKREALNQLALAHEKGVPFRQQDTLLLADLYAVNDNPHGAARLLQSALLDQTIAVSGENYRKQFEYWLQARERDQAIAALGEAARLTGDTELYLYLAQLYSEQEAWQSMQEAVLAACAVELADQYVSRANLLLGISQAKLGDSGGARRSFINATLIAGASAQAAKWLRFIDAEPVTRPEARKIIGPCYGSEDKRRALQAAAGVDESEDAETIVSRPGEKAVTAIKTIPEQRLYTVAYSMTPAEAAEQALSLATRLAVNLVRAGGDVDGALHMLFDGPLPAPGEPVDFELALPVRGKPRPSGRYSERIAGPFRCSYLLYQGPVDDIAVAWEELARSTRESGYQLSGQARYVFTRGGSVPAGHVALELQLGIE